MAANIRPSFLIAFFLPNLEGGGAERAIVALANSIAELDVIVDLVLGDAIGPCLAEFLYVLRSYPVSEIACQF